MTSETPFPFPNRVPPNPSKLHRESAGMRSVEELSRIRRLTVPSWRWIQLHTAIWYLLRCAVSIEMTPAREYASFSHFLPSAFRFLVSGFRRYPRGLRGYDGHDSILVDCEKWAVSPRNEPLLIELNSIRMFHCGDGTACIEMTRRCCETKRWDSSPQGGRIANQHCGNQNSEMN